jgi:MerR family transcriptional regulator, mercuric resistance operon regulatory protein
MRSVSYELRIGEVAARSGVSIDTIRYYERRKLLPRAERSRGGFRLYRQEAVERLRFIKQAQEIGFSLDEIGDLLATGGAAECRKVRDLLRAKVEEVDARIEAMRKFRRSLADHLAACERELKERGNAARCPVVIEISRGMDQPQAVVKMEKKR